MSAAPTPVAATTRPGPTIFHLAGLPPSSSMRSAWDTMTGGTLSFVGICLWFLTLVFAVGAGELPSRRHRQHHPAHPTVRQITRKTPCGGGCPPVDAGPGP